MEGLFGFIVVLVVIFFIFSKIFRIVNQSEVLVIERLGKYRKTATAGLNIVLPFIERVRARVDLREQTMDVQPQSVIMCYDWCGKRMIVFP